MTWRRRRYPRPTQAQSRVEAPQLERIALVAFLVALVPLGVFLAVWIPDRRLANGPQVEATVVRVEYVRRASKGPPDTSVVAVRFATNDGQKIDTKLRTTRTSFGPTVLLTYDPNDPQQVRATEGPELAWRVPLILGLTIAWFGGLQAWLAIRLRVGRPSRVWLKSRRPKADDVP